MKKIFIFLFALLVLGACNFGRYDFIDSSKTDEVSLGKFFEIDEPYKFDSPPLGLFVSDNLAFGTENTKLYFGAKALKNPSTIVLLAQDNSIDSSIMTCKKCVYHTGFGDLYTDKDLVNKFIKETTAQSNQNYFKNEKTIADQTIFVKKIFGDVKILPIVIGKDVDIKDLDNLVTWINQNLPLDTLISYATHFSKEVPQSVTDFHDASAIDTITNFDYANLKNLSSNSYESDYFFLKFMDKRGFQNVNNLGSFNSGQGLKEHVELTTSFNLLAFLRGVVDIKKSVSILSFGNMPKDSDLEFSVGHKYDSNYNPLADITTARFLKDLRGNSDGFLRGVDYAVYGLIKDDCRIDKKNEFEVAFCNFDQNTDEDEMLDTLQSLNVDVVYVLYEYNDGFVDKSIAKKIINLGADIFVGRGAKDVMPFEKYKSGLIFYSLGNAITDSKLFTGESNSSSGMVLGLYITENDFTIHTFPIEIVNGYPKLLDFSLRVSEFMKFTSALDTDEIDFYETLTGVVKLSR